MSTETTETTSTPEPTAWVEGVDRLQSDLENIQRELDQALEVWRRTLLDEKKELEGEIHTKESDWKNREQEWAQQRRAYEDKLNALDVSFKTQLDASEQNALRALNDLDDVWQRDKLSWSQAADQKFKDLQLRFQQLQQTHDQQSGSIQELQAKNISLENIGASYEKQLRVFTEDRERERIGYIELIEGLEGALKRGEQARVQMDVQQEMLVQERVQKQAALWEGQQKANDQRALQLEQQLLQESAGFEAERRQTAEANDQALLQLKKEFEEKSHLRNDESAVLQKKVEALELKGLELENGFSQRLEQAQSEWQALHHADIQRWENQSFAWNEERSKLQEDLEHFRASNVQLEKAYAQEREKVQRERLEQQQAELVRWDTERQASADKIRSLEEAVLQMKNAHQQELLAKENRHRADLQTQIENHAAVSEAERRRFEQQAELHGQTLKGAVNQATAELKQSWEKERETWQQALLRAMQSTSKREADWILERQALEQMNRQLSDELVNVQKQLASLQSQAAERIGVVHPHLQALEQQVSILHEMTQLIGRSKESRPHPLIDLVPLAPSPRAFR